MGSPSRSMLLHHAQPGSSGIHYDEMCYPCPPRHCVTLWVSGRAIKVKMGGKIQFLSCSLVLKPWQCGRAPDACRQPWSDVVYGWKYKNHVFYEPFGVQDCIAPCSCMHADRSSCLPSFDHNAWTFSSRLRCSRFRRRAITK